MKPNIKQWQILMERRRDERIKRLRCRCEANKMCDRRPYQYRLSLKPCFELEAKDLSLKIKFRSKENQEKRGIVLSISSQG